MPRFRLWHMFTSVTFVAVLIVLMRNRNQWIADLSYTTTIAGLAYIALGASIFRGKQRRFFLGALLFGGIYFAVSSSVLFNTRESKLITFAATAWLFDIEFNPDLPDAFYHTRLQDYYRFHTIAQCGLTALVSIAGGYCALWMGNISDRYELRSKEDAA